MTARPKKALAASGGAGVAMTVPGILATIVLWRAIPDTMGSLTPLEQNGIFAGLVGGLGYFTAVIKSWAEDLLPGHPHNLLLRLLSGGE